MDSSVFLEHLRESSLEVGRAHIQNHIGELSDLGATGDLLANEALKQLYTPFLSLKLSELLIFFGDCTHHLPVHALGLKAKGDALVQIKHYQAALEALNAAGEEFLSLGDEGNWARSRISWVTAATALGRVEEALQQAHRAREVFLHLNEPYWVCIIDHNTALVYKQVGRYQDAGRLFERLLTNYPTITNQSEVFIKRATAMAKESHAITLSWLGEFEQAYRLQEEAQASFVALGETNMAVNSEINLGNFDYTRGYYGSALRRYYQAQDILIQNAVDNPKIVAELKVLMANALVKLNRADEACELAYEAAEIYRRLGTSLHATNALREYAMALVASARLEEALAVLNEAEELFERGGLDHYALATRLQRAELLLEMGDAARAFDEARILKGYFEAQGLVARVVSTNLVMIGALLEEIKQTDREQEQRDALLQEAVTLCEEATLQAHQHHLREEVYRSEYLLGQLFALRGEVTKAEEYYGAAIAQIERMLEDLVYDLSPSFLQSAWAVYEDMIALCLQQECPERAFGYLEQARSSALRQHLATSKAALDERDTLEESEKSTAPSRPQTTSAALLRIQGELKVWQDRYRDYSVLLTNVDTSVSPDVEREIVEAELKRCEAKLSELFERFYLHQATAKIRPHMEHEERVRAHAFKVAELRQHLSSDQLLLAYFVYRGRLIIFAITATHLVTFENPDGMKQLKRSLPMLHAHLQPGGWADPHHPPQQGVRQMLKKLYDLLIAPAAALLPSQSRSLTIVPYGPLHTLPFHALYDGSRFLIEEFQVNYLPASSLLTASRADRATAASKSPLIFGYSGHGHLQRAIDEAKTLAAMLSGRCYLEEEATIAQLIEEAPGSPIIHLATHGHSRLDAPNFSSVLLADGRFNAIDAFSLDLQGCELVTLSGCETGLAMSGGGDEQLGLGRAFLAAGVDTLVISLWPVEDDATNELMQLFYRNLRRGESKVQALRSAQCALLLRTEPTRARYSHPYYWAAFRLVGGVGPLRYLGAEARSFARETAS